MNGTTLPDYPVTVIINQYLRYWCLSNWLVGRVAVLFFSVILETSYLGVQWYCYIKPFIVAVYIHNH